MVKVTVHPELRYICFCGYSGSSNVQYFKEGGGGKGVRGLFPCAAGWKVAFSQLD